MLCLLIYFLYSLHNLTIVLKETNKAMKYTLSLVVTIIALLGFYNLDIELKKLSDKKVSNSYCLNKFFNNKEIKNIDLKIFEYECLNTLLVNSKEVEQHRKYLERNIKYTKYISILLPLITVLYLLTLIIRIEINKIIEKETYILWYLSEKLGWVQGTKVMKNSKKRVLKPNDCLKIIKIKTEVNFLE